MEYLKTSIKSASKHFKFGIALFETIKIKGGRPVFLTEHMDRIYASASQLGISTPVGKDELTQAVLDFSKGLEEKALRVTVNEEGFHFDTRDIGYREDGWNDGIDICLSSIRRGLSFLYFHKTANYFENIYAKEKASKAGFDDALFLNTEGSVLETSVANIFFSKDGKIYTPKLELGLLNGIIRSKVISSCMILGIETCEEEIGFEDICGFDGCFITNSLMDIRRVKRIGEFSYGEDRMFSRILSKLKELEDE